jgi:mannose-6-phosphate isomerase-like protein (cupin superfamily)
MLTQEPAAQIAAARVLRRGDGPTLGRAGDTMEIRIRSEATGGAWALIESIIPPATGGPPLHINTGEDETFYILEGALLVQIGERQVTLTPGCVGYIPRGTVHTFCNPYNAAVRTLGLISPGGFEHFFEESAALVAQMTPGVPPDVAAQMALSRKYGGVVVGPPLPVPDPPLPLPV